MLDNFIQTNAGNDGYSTDTSILQEEIEGGVLECMLENQGKTLEIDLHLAYLDKVLHTGLTKWFVALDASKPWLIYWILHSKDILGTKLESSIKSRALEALCTCQCSSGGYSGGPGQLAHLATSYAAVNSIAIIGIAVAFDSINLHGMYTFLMRMKQQDGSFRMHDGGEIDIRGTYCALSIATLLNLTTPELIKDVATFITRCQTFEGGLGPVPGVEAHGGYTYCGLAALSLINHCDKLDLNLLRYWVVARQMQSEGGFQGRTNKLVDGCYSFWQGGTAVILDIIANNSVDRNSIFDKNRLQEYVLLACQSDKGGLRDKPGKL